MFIQVTDLHGKTLVIGVRHIMVVTPASNGCNISMVDGREIRSTTTMSAINNQLVRPQ